MDSVNPTRRALEGELASWADVPAFALGSGHIVPANWVLGPSTAHRRRLAKTWEAVVRPGSDFFNSAAAVLDRMPRAARKKAKTAWKRNPRYRGLRPWKKGQSGNPAGRPKGSRNKVHHRLAMDELVNLTKSKRAPAAVKLRATR